MKLNYEEYGSGRPLIILHGLFGSLDNWRTISRALAGRFKVFAVDQRNHGASPHSSAFNYRVMAEDLQEFMVEHRIESASLLGHSMGGKTAMQFAFLHPGMVDHLIVVDILPGRYRDGDQRTPQILQKFIALPELSTLKEVHSLMSPDIPDISIRHLLLKNLARNERGLFEWRINMRGIVDNFERMSDEVSGEPFLKPCLFIRGEGSDHVSDDGWAQARKHFPSASLITIREAGHWVHADRPEEFLAAVSAFLTRV